VENAEPVRHPGNQALFRALDLSILSTFVGLPLHLHAEGLRGTGKTTIIRSVRRRLPLIQRVRGCIYNCIPWAPHCPEHRRLSRSELRAIGTEWVPMPFKEISHSAKVGTVAGSIDLARLTDRGHPEAALLPGTLAQAHRGIVFVDEVNRLADTAPELADILLDVMGTKPGRLQIEETGLPGVELPVSVSVWAASNPDEDPGPLEDIRKQLSDRFDFVIAMERPSALQTVRDILRLSRERCLALAEIPAWVEREAEVGEGGIPVVATAGASTASVEPSLGEWVRLAEAVRTVRCPPEVDELVASLYVDFGLESLRAVEAIHHGARLNCVLEGREAISAADVAAVAPGALQHRLDAATFARVMDRLEELRGAREGVEAETAVPVPAGSGSSAESRTTGAAGDPARLGPGQAAAGGSVPTSGRPGGSPPDAQPGPFSLWSIFGRRVRRSGVSGASSLPQGETARPGPAGGPYATGGASPEGGSASASGDATPLSLRASSVSSGGADAAGLSSPDGDESVVAPPNAARPLAQILREMGLGALEPGGPEPPVRPVP